MLNFASMFQLDLIKYGFIQTCLHMCISANAPKCLFALPYVHCSTLLHQGCYNSAPVPSHALFLDAELSPEQHAGWGADESSAAES